MDSVTHIVLGAAVGEAFMGKQIGKKAMFWGAVAGSAPDIDGLMNFFVSDIDALVMHRGITHSIFTALLAGPLLGWILWKAYREKGLLRSWMLLFTTNILLHDFLDACNVYGTGLLTPFTDYRFSFDTLFVADPLVTVPLLVTTMGLLYLRAGHPARSRWTRTGMGISATYILFSFYGQFNASQALMESLEEKQITADAHFAAPTLFNSMLWNVVARDSSGFYVGYYSVFDSQYRPELHFIPQNKDLLSLVQPADEIQKLISFSKGFYCMTESEGRLYFNDLRFGQVGGWESPQAKFAFAFDLSENADNTMVVQQGRIDGSRKEMLTSMFNRIRGN